MKRIREIVIRELHLWGKRPIYLLGSVGVMLASAIFFLTFMSEGVPEDIPIGVVDRDLSSTSRNFIRQLDDRGRRKAQINRRQENIHLFLIRSFLQRL